MNAKFRGITLRQFLSHTSGMQRDDDWPGAGDRGSDAVMPIERDYPFSETVIFDAPGFPRLHFVERQYCADQTNWWIKSATLESGYFPLTYANGAPFRGAYYLTVTPGGLSSVPLPPAEKKL